jgi:hypothetical protein
MRATRRRPPGKVGIGSISNHPTSVRKPAAKKNGWLQSRLSMESGEMDAKSSMRKGAFARYGSSVRAYESVVNASPRNQKINPETSMTNGTEIEAHASDTRSGHGRASILGKVGMKKIPNGQMKYEVDNPENNHNKTEGSGIGRMCPLRTPNRADILV